MVSRKRWVSIAAVAGYVVPSTGSMLDLAAVNWNTCLGAACFLSCALAGLHHNRSFEDAATAQATAPQHRQALDLLRPSDVTGPMS
jgi:hypothetical protein